MGNHVVPGLTRDRWPPNATFRQEASDPGFRRDDELTTDRPMRSIPDILEEFLFLEGDDRHRLMIELGRELEPMPDALKTEATRVKGCQSIVWAYPLATEEGVLHFLADSNSSFTKGMIAVVLSAVQDRPASEVAAMDIEGLIKPFGFEKQMTSTRTSGLPNMIALIREHAARIAAA